MNFESLLHGWERMAVAGAVIMLGTHVCAVLCRSHAAASKRLLWSSSFCGLMLVSAFAFLPFRVHVPIAVEQTVNANLESADSQLPDWDQGTASTANGVSHSAATQPSSKQSFVFSFPHAIAGLWLAGAFLLFVRWTVGVWRVRRFLQLSVRAPSSMRVHLERLAHESGLRRNVLLTEHPTICVPLTVGTVTPRIVLPVSARDWTSERLVAVLTHELAHIAQYDSLIRSVAELSAAFHWFNPLVWLGLRRLDIEREIAADDFVLSSGFRPSAYARHLVEIAEASAEPPPQITTAILMARRSNLPERVGRILANGRPRLASIRFKLLTMVVFGGVVGVFGCVSVDTSPRARDVSTAPSTTEVDARVERRVRAILADKSQGGIVVGILRDGQTRVLGFGQARNGTSTSPDGDTVFDVGSITELFTGVAFSRLATEGHISWNDRLKDYLPAGVGAPQRDGREITLIDLATHMAGLPALPSNFIEQDRANSIHGYTKDRLYAFLGTYSPETVPGSTFKYSYLGVGLLGHALAERQGTTYRDLVADLVLSPLGMKDTDFFGRAERLDPRLADGHEPSGASVRARSDFPTLGSCCAGRTTANDLLKLVSASADPASSPWPQALEEMQRPRASYRADERVGIGWHIQDGTLLFKRGGGKGFSSFVVLNRARREGVVVLANYEGIDGETFAAEVLRDMSRSANSAPSAIGAATTKTPDGMTPVGTDFSGKVRLVGWKVDRAQAHPGDRVELLLQYQALAPIDYDWRIFLHGDAADGTRWIRADHYPVANTSSTDEWHVGQTIVDRIEVTIPNETPPGNLTFWTGWYGATGRLHVTPVAQGDAHDRVRGPSIQVVR